MRPEYVDQLKEGGLQFAFLQRAEARERATVASWYALWSCPQTRFRGQYPDQNAEWHGK